MNSETAIMSDKIDRSAISRTDSDLALLASSSISSVAQVTRRETVENRGERVRGGTSLKTIAFEASFAPIRELPEKGADKHGENREKRAEKWRKVAVFRGPRSPFCRGRRRRRENVTR
jgi:hypothetical protein